MRLKQILFGFSRPVVKATMVITYTYSDAHKLPSANYPQLSVTLDSDQLAIKTQCGVSWWAAERGIQQRPGTFAHRHAARFEKVHCNAAHALVLTLPP